MLSIYRFSRNFPQVLVDSALTRWDSQLNNAEQCTNSNLWKSYLTWPTFVEFKRRFWIHAWGLTAAMSVRSRNLVEAYSYTKQFANVLKNLLQGRSCTTTHLPIAKASAVVVATTSLLLGFTNTLYLCMESSKWSLPPWNFMSNFRFWANCFICTEVSRLQWVVWSSYLSIFEIHTAFKNRRLFLTTEPILIMTLVLHCDLLLLRQIDTALDDRQYVVN